MISRLRLSSCLFVIAALAAVPSAAQTPASQPSQPQQEVPKINETVEVVATRAPETPGEVPIAIETISGDELRSRGVTDLRSALALATGVDIAPGGDGGPASAVPEFLGLKEFDAFLLVVDDVPWGGAFNPALSTLNMNDVERIEILRGPAPVMYGATSFVGVIHVVHKPAAAASRSFGARFGSYGSGGASVDLGLPLGSWESRFSASGERQGFQDDRTSFRRGNFLWRSTRKMTNGRVWFTVDGSIVDQNPASPHLRQGTALSTITPLDANYNPAGAFLNDDRFSGSFGFERTSGARTWTTMVSVSHGKQDILRGFLLDAVETSPNAHGLREQIDLTDLYADSHATWSLRPDVKLIVGGDYLHGSGNANGADFDYVVPLSGAVAVSVPEPDALDVNVTDRREFAGGYASVEWTATDRLRVDAGARLNVTSEEHDTKDPEAPPETTDPGAQNHVRPSGSVGAIWSAWNEGPDYVRLFANYRNTFKPAAVDFGIGEGDAGEGGPLKPETSQSVEGGLKVRTWQGRASLDATAFLMDFKNLVIAQIVNGVPGLTNAGTERFQGFELGSAFFLPHSVTARASYSFHDSKFRDYVTQFDGVPTQLAGRRLEMSPRNLASAGFAYAPAKGIVASAELQLVGSRFLDKRNRSLADGYATLGAGVGYRAGAWDVRLDGHNLSDERPPIAESELGDAEYYRLPGRRVDVSVAVRFGG